MRLFTSHFVCALTIFCSCTHVHAGSPVEPTGSFFRGDSSFNTTLLFRCGSLVRDESHVDTESPAATPIWGFEHWAVMAEKVQGEIVNLHEEGYDDGCWNEYPEAVDSARDGSVEYVLTRDGIRISIVWMPVEESAFLVKKIVTLTNVGNESFIQVRFHSGWYIEPDPSRLVVRNYAPAPEVYFQGVDEDLYWDYREPSSADRFNQEPRNAPFDANTTVELSSIIWGIDCGALAPEASVELTLFAGILSTTAAAEQAARALNAPIASWHSPSEFEGYAPAEYPSALYAYGGITPTPVHSRICTTWEQREYCEDLTCSKADSEVRCGGCDEGFVTAREGNSTHRPQCADVDECLDRAMAGRCLNSAQCVNTHGSFQCECPAGYEGDGATSCEDVDECRTWSGHTCQGTGTICTNTEGSFVCSCPEGFYVFSASWGHYFCEDVNECASADKSSRCDANGGCRNTQGSFDCECSAGFTGSGMAGDCADVDECTAGVDTCHELSACHNTFGSFTCSCSAGYRTAPPAEPRCTGAGKCFFLVQAPLAWQQAEERCVGYGGHLASVVDAEEDDLVRELLSDSGVATAWTGYAYVSFGNWKWTDGTSEPGLGFVSATKYVGYDCARWTAAGLEARVCSNANAWVCSMQGPEVNAGTHCVDDDECVGGTHSCALAAACQNTEGSFLCTCDTTVFAQLGSLCTPWQHPSSVPAPETLCLENRSWAELGREFGDRGEDRGMVSGGLGHLLVEDKFEAWACLKNHPCLPAANGDYMCFVFDEELSVFVPWRPESELGLVGDTLTREAAAADARCGTATLNLAARCARVEEAAYGEAPQQGALVQRVAALEALLLGGSARQGELPPRVRQLETVAGLCG